MTFLNIEPFHEAYLIVAPKAFNMHYEKLCTQEKKCNPLFSGLKHVFKVFLPKSVCLLPCPLILQCRYHLIFPRKIQGTPGPSGGLILMVEV